MRARKYFFLFFTVIDRRLPVMRVIHVTPNPETQNAADKNVRKEVFFSSKARHTDGGCDPICSYLSGTIVGIFARDYCCHRPRVNRMARRKRSATSKEIAAMMFRQRTTSFGDGFQRHDNYLAVDQSLPAKQPGFSGARVVLGASRQIEHRAHGRGAVRRTG